MFFVKLIRSFYIIRHPPDLRLSLGPVQSAGRLSALLGVDRRLALRSRRFAYNSRFVVVGTFLVSRLRPRGAAAVALPRCRVYRLPVRRRCVSRTVVRLRIIQWSAVVRIRHH